MTRDEIIWSEIQIAISRCTSLDEIEKVGLVCQIREALLDGIKAWMTTGADGEGHTRWHEGAEGRWTAALRVRNAK